MCYIRDIDSLPQKFSIHFIHQPHFRWLLVPGLVAEWIVYGFAWCSKYYFRGFFLPFHDYNFGANTESLKCWHPNGRMQRCQILAQYWLPTVALREHQSQMSKLKSQIHMCCRVDKLLVILLILFFAVVDSVFLYL